MTMETNLNRKHGGYNGESVAQRLKKGRLNQGGGQAEGSGFEYHAMRLGFFPTFRKVF